MEEKNSGFSLNRRLLRALRRRARGEGGVTLVEMMVSLFIFAIVSTMFTVSIVQYLHSTTADAIRTRSATEIATSVQALDRYVRNAEGVEEAASGDRLTLVTTDADGIRQCAVIEYTEATWSGGRVDDYGSVVVKTRPYATGAGGAWSEHAVLTAVMNNSTASTSDDSLFKNKLFSMGWRYARGAVFAGDGFVCGWQAGHLEHIDIVYSSQCGFECFGRLQSMSLNDGVCKGSPLWGSPFSILPNTPDAPGGKWFFDEFRQNMLKIFSETLLKI